MPFVFQGLRFDEVPPSQSADGTFKVTLQFRPSPPSATSQSTSNQSYFNATNTAFDSQTHQQTNPSSRAYDRDHQSYPRRLLTQYGNGDYPTANFRRPGPSDSHSVAQRAEQVPEAVTSQPINNTGKIAKKKKKRARFKVAWTSIRDIFSVASSAASLAT